MRVAGFTSLATCRRDPRALTRTWVLAWDAAPRKLIRWSLRLPDVETGGRLRIMTNALRKELFQLSTAERLELVEELWDSIAAERESEPFPLTAAQRQELDEHPERARPWDEVRKRLWARKRA